MNARFYLSYDIKITLKSDFCRKNVIILLLCKQRCYGLHNVSRTSIKHYWFIHFIALLDTTLFDAQRRKRALMGRFSHFQLLICVLFVIHLSPKKRFCIAVPFDLTSHFYQRYVKIMERSARIINLLANVG